MSAFAAAAQDEDGDTIATLRAAIEQARDWIAEHPDRRPISAGRVVAILTNALGAAPQPPVVEPWQGEQGVKSYKITGKTGEFCVFHSTEVKRGDMVYTHPQPKRQPLTDELIDKIANGMPGGLDGFMKGWGWRQFARAVEAHGIGGEA